MKRSEGKIRFETLTARERRAYRWGFVDGVEHAARQLELFRIRLAGRSVQIDVPRHWPRWPTGSTP